MRYILLVLGVLVFALLLASCASPEYPPAVASEQKVESNAIPQETVDPCFGVSCQSGFTCAGGSCVCGQGTKDCRGSCIAASSCCANSDCAGGQLCQNSICVKPCRELDCESNKICNAETQECVCPLDYTWCGVQSKCIPRNACCTNQECSRGEDCAFTYFTAGVCLESGDVSSCKKIPMNTPREIMVGLLSYKVDVKKVVPDSYATLSVGGTLLSKQEKNVKFTLPDQTRGYVKTIESTGGTCQS